MTPPEPSRRPRIRLWMKLAAFAAAGITLTHLVYLAVSSRVATYALARQQEALGAGVADLIARVAVEAVLVDDLVALQEVVASAASHEGVAYCFVLRDGRVLASSFAGATPPPLVAARSPADAGPLIVTAGAERYLDVVAPILGGGAGAVRVGLSMERVRSTSRAVASSLGWLALAVIAGGVVAAFLVGRAIARPVGDILSAATRFDPAAEPPIVTPRGTDEIGELTERFNGMMIRLKAAHDEQARARRQHVSTERMAALGSLVAGVAHEVNNPLAGLKNCLWRLQREAEAGSPRSRQYLSLMEEGIGRVEDVMRRLLDFARPRPLELHALPARDVVRAGSSLVRPLLARRDVALLEEGGDALVIADPKQAAQALLNLLLNALYVTTDGGQVRIRRRERPGFHGIAVEDDGPGVPPEIRDRIFDPFFSTKPEGEGTGLGLSVTRSIVDAHGGELTIESSERGTSATMWLRLADAKQGEAAGPGG